MIHIITILVLREKIFMARNLILSRFRLRYIDYAPKNLNYY